MQPTNKPRVNGAIFENTSGRGPAYTGVVEIDGVKTQIALWPKVSQAGKDYLQISEDKKRPQAQGNLAPRPSQGFSPQRPVQPRPAPGKNSDMDDDIPF